MTEQEWAQALAAAMSFGRRRLTRREREAGAAQLLRAAEWVVRGVNVAESHRADAAEHAVERLLEGRFRGETVPALRRWLKGVVVHYLIDVTRRSDWKSLEREEGATENQTLDATGAAMDARSHEHSVLGALDGRAELRRVRALFRKVMLSAKGRRPRIEFFLCYLLGAELGPESRSGHYKDASMGRRYFGELVQALALEGALTDDELVLAARVSGDDLSERPIDDSQEGE